MSFYGWYCDLPPSSPQTWGEQTDVPESADWYNAGFLMVWGSNVPQTRTPDAHFMTEARYRGTKVAVVSPDYAEATKFADLWLNPKQGTDARSEERRVGKEGGRRCKSRGSPEHSKRKNTRWIRESETVH